MTSTALLIETGSVLPPERLLTNASIDSLEFDKEKNKKPHPIKPLVGIISRFI